MAEAQAGLGGEYTRNGVRISAKNIRSIETPVAFPAAFPAALPTFRPPEQPERWRSLWPARG